MIAGINLPQSDACTNCQWASALGSAKACAANISFTETHVYRPQLFAWGPWNWTLQLADKRRRVRSSFAHIALLFENFLNLTPLFCSEMVNAPLSPSTGKICLQRRTWPWYILQGDVGKTLNEGEIKAEGKECAPTMQHLTAKMAWKMKNVKWHAYFFVRNGSYENMQVSRGAFVI